MIKIIRCAEDAATVIRPAFPKRLFSAQECFAVMCLDAKNKTISKPKIVAIGTLTNVSVRPRDIFREAIRINAVGIIIAHNHPSGDLSISRDDKIITQRLTEAANLLEIKLLDHLIITKQSYFSFCDNNLLG